VPGIASVAQLCSYAVSSGAAPGSTVLVYSDCRNTGWSGSGASPQSELVPRVSF